MNRSTLDYSTHEEGDFRPCAKSPCAEPGLCGHAGECYKRAFPADTADALLRLLWNEATEVHGIDTCSDALRKRIKEYLSLEC